MPDRVGALAGKCDLRTIGGVLTALPVVVISSIKQFLRVRAPQAAAGMAFYAVFSLFPILLILVAVGSVLLNALGADQQVLDLLLRFFPISGDLIRQNMVQVLEARGTVEIVSTLGLLWSATSGFAVLVRNVNRAWPSAVPQNIVKARLIALLVVGSLVALTALFLVGKSLLGLVSGLNWATGQVIEALRLGAVLSRVSAFLVIATALVPLYLWVPSIHVRWCEAVSGAMVASAGSLVATFAFAWYLRSGLAKYNLVYGSVGALLAFLTWIYVISLIVLYGAHLSAAVARQTRGAPDTRRPALMRL